MSKYEDIKAKIDGGKVKKALLNPHTPEARTRAEAEYKAKPDDIWLAEFWLDCRDIYRETVALRAEVEALDDREDWTAQVRLPGAISNACQKISVRGSQFEKGDWEAILSAADEYYYAIITHQREAALSAIDKGLRSFATGLEKLYKIDVTKEWDNVTD